MVPIGWAGGVIGFLLAAGISLYANSLIAKLHDFGRNNQEWLLLGTPFLLMISVAMTVSMRTRARNHRKQCTEHLQK